ncbi:hypothetical protein [Piscirickettsia litoralis]|uniref:Uncharacterized protein n=1 Tax=Piscirickettsia litoralis TaxID=1891921 RepID=A0ABX3A3H7_9GAMM|nr:hypothetical protein [Piscirickettsia litoralis]ODN41980.1 hypothetical protein BGC07_02155 [Piscirickettsia litoralis]
MAVLKPLLVGMIAAGLSSSLYAAENIAICEDGAEWPPFHYIKRDAGKKVPGASEGYSVDVINKNFSRDSIFLF